MMGRIRRRGLARGARRSRPCRSIFLSPRPCPPLCDDDDDDGAAAIATTGIVFIIIVLVSRVDDETRVSKK